MKRVVRRTRQFVCAVLARVSAREIQETRIALTPAQFALFAQMQRSDQRHSLDVWNALRSAGHDDPSLLQAALLHDVGKAAARLSVWHRVAFVLLKRFVPDWLARQANVEQGSPAPHRSQSSTLWTRWFRVPLTVYAQHAQLSADWAAQAGSDPAVVDCIRSHHQPGSNPMSAALHWADEQH